MRSTQQIDDIDRSIIRLEQLRVIAGNTDVDSIKSAAASLPEVIELFTVAGDPDALLRIRADNVHHLQRVVDSLRRTTQVIGTKTLIVLNKSGGEMARRHLNHSLRPSTPIDVHSPMSR